MTRKKPLRRKTPLRAGKPLKQASTKRAAQLREYAKLRKAFLEEHPRCEVRWFMGEMAPINEKGSPHCPYSATDIHHMGRRNGERLNYVPHWLPACRQCHDIIETNARTARRLGYLI